MPCSMRIGVWKSLRRARHARGCWGTMADGRRGALLLLPLLLQLLLIARSDAAESKRAFVKNRQLFVNNTLFEVRGVCYSPVPINESVYFAPYGDYFTKEYSFIWLRDLPLIRAMGANFVRVYGWAPDNDHSAFLDAMHAHGLYLMATFYMGEASETPVGTPEERSKIISSFRQQVREYRNHPALLMWSFGNELNGVWNGYLQQLGHSQVCGCGAEHAWDRYVDGAQAEGTHGSTPISWRGCSHGGKSICIVASHL
eukprot:1702539-Pleurochrysis_carterae.AAC.1